MVIDFIYVRNVGSLNIEFNDNRSMKIFIWNINLKWLCQKVDLYEEDVNLFHISPIACTLLEDYLFILNLYSLDILGDI